MVPGVGRGVGVHEVRGRTRNGELVSHADAGIVVGPVVVEEGVDGTVDPAVAVRVELA